MRSDALNPQDALVAVMIATSAADDTMTVPELHEITAIVGVLPVFEGYDTDRIAEMEDGRVIRVTKGSGGVHV